MSKMKILGVAVTACCITLTALQYWRSGRNGKVNFSRPPHAQNSDTDKQKDSLKRAMELNESLARELEKKLSRFLSITPEIPDENCESVRISSKVPCVDTTCPADFSPIPGVRLEQILATTNSSLHLLGVAMATAVQRVRWSKYLFVSGASSNHYTELQALVKNLNTYVFPRLRQKDYTFVVFDLGLTPEERDMTKKKCGCAFLTFPFENLPSVFSDLTCYTWKPLIIRSLIEKAEILIWMDTSIRWSRKSPLDRLFRNCQKRGLLLRYSKGGTIGLRTDSKTFRFYGDQRCQYYRFRTVGAGFLLAHNEPFVRHAVLDPWLSCAASRQCMCVQAVQGCKGTVRGAANTCHRFDQSSLGLIVSKLFSYRVNLVKVKDSVSKVAVLRGDTTNSWFTNRTTREHKEETLG